MPAVNGVANSVLHLANHLDRRGHDVRILAPSPGVDLVSLDSGAMIPVERLSSMRVPGYRTLRVATARLRAIRRSPELRARLGVGSDDVVIGYVGRLAREKQVDQLRHVQHLAGTKVLVVGDGPERRKLERVLPNAHFTGFLSGDALGAAMASIDVFVHTGAHETFCQAIQEAMSCGIPVVAPAAGGPLGRYDALLEPALTR